MDNFYKKLKHEWKVYNLKMIFDTESIDYTFNKIRDFVRMKVLNNETCSASGKSIGSSKKNLRHSQQVSTKDQISKPKLSTSSVQVPRIINHPTICEHQFYNVSSISSISYFDSEENFRGNFHHSSTNNHKSRNNMFPLHSAIWSPRISRRGTNSYNMFHHSEYDQVNDA